MKVFLSAVSGQFKACRDELASDLRAIGCEVKVQEDFQQHGRTLLEKLESYIDQCDRLIAIVGDAYGFELDEEARVAAALRWLAEHPGWFLILDNVDTEEAAEYVEQLLPRLQRGHVLITSRLARWPGLVQPLELDVLAADDAAEFLLQRTGPQGGRGRKITADDAGDAAALAGDLDGLALALEQVGAYIVARRKSLGEYRQLWQLHDARVQTWHRPREMKYPHSVAVTWQTTLDQLGDDERALLNLLAWCDAEPVPLSVFADHSALSASLRFKKRDENAEDAENAEEEGEQDQTRSGFTQRWPTWPTSACCVGRRRR